MSAARTDITRRQREIVTPECLRLTLVLASRGARLGALLIDLTLIFASFIALVLGLAGMAGGVHNLSNVQAGNALQFLFIVLIAGMFLLRNAWFIAFEIGPRGATPGKRLLGIRVAARDGQRLSADRVIARNLLRDIEVFYPIVMLGSAAGHHESAQAWASAGWFLLFGLFLCFNRDHLRAGDLIAGTWVVETPRRKLEATVAEAAAPLAGPTAYRFGEAELSVYGEYELQTLERILRDARPEAMEATAAAICGKIGWHAPTGHEVPAFLEAY